jgi:hypothetical protein
MLSAVGRIVLVGFAFMAAVAMALFMVIWIGLERATGTLRTDDDAWSTVLGWLRHAMHLPFLLTLMLALTVVVVGEVARIRSALFYIAGGGIAVATAPLLIEVQRVGVTAGLPAFVWQIFATAGFCGGAVYWLLAGRRA